ncbi:hypothetical protein G4G27_13740 [Sphingomonas sp. So64.6b]|uniref:hypothetical protein n=1 Tax=Sphingomonas sp. So64.6b TaxID=2997354 RepID=UPI0016039B9F|nr:hypothetical protein [Sphingomonas sp. So64.6b]QNA84939.1 hypothetical protein G4G27_13740 [Sphingomonas sp. So64.6b]
MPLMGPRGTKPINTQPSTKAERQEFFLPVNGFVWFYPEEVAVIDHPAFQRLSKINQLGQAHYVYRGATHKRIEHVMGAVGVVQKMISAVAINAEKARVRQEADRRAPLNTSEERFVRLGALLHDIGHLASGHTLEDELNLFDKHDEDERLSLVFGEVNWNTGDQTERLASVIDRNFANYVPDDLKTQGVTPSEIVRLLIRKKPKNSIGKYDPLKDSYLKQQKILEGSRSIRLDVCTNMIGNTICADLLDYIYRDWYHVGKMLVSEDRIFQYMEIRNLEPVNLHDEVPEESRRDHKDVFVLALGTNVGPSAKIRTDGISAILGLLERRYELAEMVLYHRTKLAAGAMLGRALYELWADENMSDLPKTLLCLSDEELLDFALKKASLTAKEPQASTRLDAPLRLLHSLRGRSLYRALYTARHWALATDQRLRLNNLFAPANDAEGRGARNRAEAARMLEADFELSPGSIVISCADIKPKIAEVQIRVNGLVKTFSAYEKQAEEDGKRGLSGGHLNAQIKRFADLWRCDFFISKDTFDALESEAPEKLMLLKDTIEQVFINPPLEGSSADRTTERLARSYVGIETARGRNSLQMLEVEPHRIAARGDPSVGTSEPTRYPGGSRTLSSYRKRRQAK